MQLDTISFKVKKIEKNDKLIQLDTTLHNFTPFSKILQK